MPSDYPDLGGTFDWLKQDSLAARLRAARFSDVFCQGNQWCRREISALFPGKTILRYTRQDLQNQFYTDLLRF